VAIRITKSKLQLIILFLVLISIGILAWYFSSRRLPGSQRPTGNFEENFLYQETFYQCSRKIEGSWEPARVGMQGSPGYYFIPKNNTDLQKYCRINAVIEYQSVLDILKREDVYDVIERYDPNVAWVRALGHKYINDKDYLKRILPAYSDIKIDCIIVVHSPEGTRFFIENGEIHESHDDHRYMEVESEKFLSSLNNSSDTDITNFWLGLH
jgi:hypothetical protein